MKADLTDPIKADGYCISVALCTYNGEKYLADQLESILSQSRLPDELIICDDGSTDSTLEILDRYRSRAPFNVKLYKNAENLGTSKNFEKALTLCTGDLILLSDQDDVWAEDRVKATEQAFASNPDLGLVFSNATIVSDRLTPKGYTLWESIRFDKNSQDLVRSGRTLDVLFRQNVVTGATVGLNARYLDFLIPLPTGCMHDAWIALVFATLSRIELIDKPLILYRQHDSQQIGAHEDGSIIHHYLREARKSMTGLNRYFSFARTEYIRWLNADTKLFGTALERAASWNLNEAAIALLQEKMKHLEKRRQILNSPRYRRLSPVAAELIGKRYRRYSNGIAYVVKDLLF